MGEKILTIVVPTYNAERYLRDNLESFALAEVLDDIEVLVINDGSTDGSLSIAAEYVSRYPNSYRAITKENGGHGSGINCGIQHALGTYYKVVDADDWVDPKAFIRLVDYLKTSESDIVYSGFYWAYDNGQECKDKFKKRAEFAKPFEAVIYQKEYAFDEIAGQGFYIKMHSMTIRTDILRKHQICLDEHCYYVDAEYIIYPIPYVKTISFVEDFVYFYRIGSAGQSVGIDKMRANEENYNRVLDSLLHFYQQLEHGIPCTAAKKRYIAKVIARIVAGKIKIMLSFPTSKRMKKNLFQFEHGLKQGFPDIYHANFNPAVRLLRNTDYRMYWAISWLVRWKY